MNVDDVTGPILEVGRISEHFSRLVLDLSHRELDRATEFPDTSLNGVVCGLATVLGIILAKEPKGEGRETLRFFAEKVLENTIRRRDDAAGHGPPRPSRPLG